MEVHGDNPTQRFKEAATFVMGDNVEMKHTAYSILDEHISRYGNASIDEASERLEHSNKKGAKRWWIFYAIVVILSLLIVLYQGGQFNQSRAMLGGMGILPGSLAPSNDGYDDYFKYLTSEQKLILFGNQNYSGPAAQMKALWDYEPDNPAYFADYSMAYLEEYGSLPTDFIQQGYLLDKGNGWYLVMQAGVLAEDVVIKKPVPRPSRSSRGSRGRGRKVTPATESQTHKTAASKKKPLAEWEVADETKYKESLALLHQAAQLKRFDSYTETMLRARIEILPQGGDFATRFIPLSYIVLLRTPALKYMYLSKVVSAEAQRCTREKDTEGLKKLVSSWEQISQGMTDDSITLVDGLVAKAWITASLPYLRDAAEACDLDNMKERFARLDTEFAESKQRRKERSDDEFDDEFDHKAGILQHFGTPSIARQIDDISAVGTMDLKPGRMVDHSFFGRVMSVAGWKLFLLVCLGIFLDSLRGGGSVRKLSQNLSGLLSKSDWLWILGMGVAAPFGYYFLINEFSPFSAREFSLMSTVFMHPAGQLVSLWIILGGLPSLLIRWRLSKACPTLGIVPGKLSVAAIACAVIAMPAFGLVMKWKDYMEWLLFGALGLLAAALILLLINLCLLFWNKKYSLRRLLCTYCVMPAYMSVALIMSLSTLLYQAEERYWVSQDEMFRHDPNEPGFTKLEYRVTQQLKKELRQTMGWAE